MLKTFDFLGLLKWPSLLAVTLVPVVSFVWFWGDFDRAVAMQFYGPEQVGSMPILLTHRADARLARDTSTLWCVRVCADCQSKIATAELGYAGATQPPNGWITARADTGARCAELPARQQDQRFIWIRVRDSNGQQSRRTWALSGEN